MEWLWELASFKDHNKGVAIYVESTTTVHNLLFYVHTRWLNNLTNSDIHSFIFIG